jgi:hypothetical protein
MQFGHSSPPIRSCSFFLSYFPTESYRVRRLFNYLWFSERLKGTPYKVMTFLRIWYREFQEQLGSRIFLHSNTPYPHKHTHKRHALTHTKDTHSLSLSLSLSLSQTHTHSFSDSLSLYQNTHTHSFTDSLSHTHAILPVKTIT